MKRTRPLLALFSLIAWAAASRGEEIGFVEDFALAPDRGEAIKQLIPGTEEAYYYQSLHLMNTGKLKDVEAQLDPWIHRYGTTDRVREIQNRLWLLRYDEDPKGASAFLQERLGLAFNHQQRLPDQKTDYPTRLDPKTLETDALARAALEHYQNLDGLTDPGLFLLAAQELTPQRRRDLLRRLARPDFPGLPELVVADLRERDSGGFGSLPIHRQLLKAQLEACLALMPELLNQSAFVESTLIRLQPAPDEDWRFDAKVRETYLERLWAFAQRLGPAHNSLKVHVLYHRLLHDQALGVYDKDRFMAYLALPRQVPYVHPDYLQRREHQGFCANLGQDFGVLTLMSPVGNDEALVRDCFMHFFVTEEAYAPYAAYVRDDYLKELFAEAKILNGIGDQARWYALMANPAKQQALKDRVDIAFAPTNRTHFDVADPVGLDVDVKNVKSLIVRVFEINTLNYCRERQQEVDLAVDLDGLEANEERTLSYDETPFRRVRRHLDFPSLNRRGVFVVELIGNGRSSRALVRKGRLAFVERLGTAGHVFTVLGEDRKPLKDAGLWMGGHAYQAGEGGEIVVPFSTKPGLQPMVLTHQGFATVAAFNHLEEHYDLAAGIYVDRESLVKGAKAKVMVRPSLSVHGTPVTLSVLEETTLEVQSVDRDGIASTVTTPLPLFEDRESVFEFQVPDRLAKLTFTLRAKVEAPSRSAKDALEARRDFDLNGIDATPRIEDLHLGRDAEGFVLWALGKNGEPLAAHPVNLALRHLRFRDEIRATLQSDPGGCIRLGPLPGITQLTADDAQGGHQAWLLPRDEAALPATIQAPAGGVVQIPCMGTEGFSLLERRGNAYTADRLDHVSIEHGFLVLRGLPAGDYELFLKDSGQAVEIRLGAGEPRDGWLQAPHRILEISNGGPLQIEQAAIEQGNLKIRLQNATRVTRVHVIGTRFLSAYDPYAHLFQGTPGLQAMALGEPESQYASGREIGDEYRYILERRFAAHFPGNMLERPSLLLNPWALRSTDTGEQGVGESERFGSRAYGGGPRSSMTHGGSALSERPPQTFSNLDFLSAPAVVLLNLIPEKDGTLTIPLKALGDSQQVQVLALAPEQTVCRQVSLPGTPLPVRDLRLAAALDPVRHVTEQRQVSCLPAGQSLTLETEGNAGTEAYDTLGKAFTLFSTLGGNETLREFRFLLDWPTLAPEKKRELYSKYACHELHFFLFKRDPAFFKEAVKPYLANKKAKTFLDEWLLERDLSEYRKPWRFARLNLVERILLAQRVPQEAEAVLRQVRERLELLPPDPEGRDRRFDAAMKAGALESGAASALLLSEKDQLNAPGAPPVESLEMDNFVRRKNGEALKKEESKNGASGAPAVMDFESEDKAYLQDAKARQQTRQFFRKPEKTQEWVESNYFHLPVEQQTADLIPVNAFWLDFAERGAQPGFLSGHLAEAAGSFPEMLFALSVLDLPWQAGEHAVASTGAQRTLTAKSPLILFHKSIQPAPEAPEKVGIMVNQNLFRLDDRYRFEQNERLDKFVSEEFLIHAVYGCQVALTNPTPSRQKLDLLAQIPQGALPVQNGFYTRGLSVQLEPYATCTVEFHFYFPAAGAYPHYPVQVARNGKLVASGSAAVLKVLEKPSRLDAASWEYVSQMGTTADVLAFLKTHNVQRLDLERIAWRMRDKEAFSSVLDLLGSLRVYHPTLWSYAILHNDTAALREYLQRADGFLDACGEYLDCPLVRIDPEVRKTYQHMEYSPLVNARAHALGKARQILNQAFLDQYRRLMHVLSCKPDLDSDDLMAVTYYLLLQDRVADAKAFFKRVDPAKLETRLQYDYLSAYLSFFDADLSAARKLAGPYRDYPVDRWRLRFREVLAEADEAEGKGTRVTDPRDRGQAQTALAATEPGVDLKIEDQKLLLHYQNLDACQVNYYPMDIELLFSKNPFAQSRGDQVAFIRPSLTETVHLPKGKDTLAVALPKRYRRTNVLVEVLAGGQRRTQAYFAHALDIQMVEAYGQVRVARQEGGKPLPAAYVKVYARMKDGAVRFYKDGYTDLRGRFDYASLSTDELDQVDRFALLVMSEKDGAVVREAAPPKR